MTATIHQFHDYGLTAAMRHIEAEPTQAEWAAFLENRAMKTPPKISYALRATYFMATGSYIAPPDPNEAPMIVDATPDMFDRPWLPLDRKPPRDVLGAVMMITVAVLFVACIWGVR